MSEGKRGGEILSGVGVFSVGEGEVFDFFDIVSDGLFDDGVEFGVFFDEGWNFVWGHSQEILGD